MNRSGISFCLILCCCTALSAKADDKLFNLIAERLDVMYQVAAFKWQHQRPIEDLKREQVVLQQTLETAREAGIDTQTSRRFFQVQIEAAKEIQFHWFNQWKEDRNKDKEVDLALQDLNADIRPRLSSLGKQILERMGEVAYLVPLPALRDQFYKLIRTKGLTHTTQAQLYDALLATFAPKPGEILYQIKQSGKLKVATTGDYAPFSYKDRQQLKGIDIDMAQDLAASLNAEIIWIQTTWPNLLDDLKEKKFHIAMSGISVKKEREDYGLFSSPYHQGGKTPIIRCSDKDRLNSLNGINQPGVRVIVNPGGTNHAFARKHIDTASLRIFDDNRTIFIEIAEGRADVMITDAIEVRLQTSRDERLCAALPGETLTHLSKAYLMPKDKRFQIFVNHWLKEQTRKGRLGSSFQKHLN